MLALREALRAQCLQPSCAAERSVDSYGFPCLSGADWHKLFPFVACVAAELEQFDSAEAVSKLCLVLYMNLSVVLLIIYVLLLLLVICCLYPYRCLFSVCFQSASHSATLSPDLLWMLP